MIYVQRDQVDEAGNAIQPNNAWFRSAETATAEATAEMHNHEADKAIYAHIEVRKALERLFHHKCAYCDTRMTSTADWEVEHFRPSGRIAEREDHLGYYWLTYVWQNLYPSCQHCNQRRKGRPTWEDPTEGPARGKADQFPLWDERTRAMGPADDAYGELTLLIDPCFDDPEEYLGYDPTGQIFSLDENPYGAKTIEVLNLSRTRLKDHRRTNMKIVTGVLKLMAKFTNEGNAGAANDLDGLLNEMQASESEHAGMARYVAQRPAEFDV